MALSTLLMDVAEYRLVNVANVYSTTSPLYTNFTEFMKYQM